MHIASCFSPELHRGTSPTPARSHPPNPLPKGQTRKPTKGKGWGYLSIDNLATSLCSNYKRTQLYFSAPMFLLYQSSDAFFSHPCPHMPNWKEPNLHRNKNKKKKKKNTYFLERHQLPLPTVSMKETDFQIGTDMLKSLIWKGQLLSANTWLTVMFQITYTGEHIQIPYTRIVNNYAS